MNLKDYSIKTFIFASALATFWSFAFYAPSSHAETKQTEGHHTEQRSRPCQDTTGATHNVTIENDTITPATTDAQICDKLTITNKDDRPREIAFGDHDHHSSYNGFGDYIVKSGESATVVLSQAGTFAFHDHFNENVKATLVVSDSHEHSSHDEHSESH